MANIYKLLNADLDPIYNIQLNHPFVIPLLMWFRFDILIYNGGQKTIEPDRVHALRNKAVPQRFRIKVPRAEKRILQTGLQPIDRVLSYPHN
jgi:hypothetical protein